MKIQFKSLKLISIALMSIALTSGCKKDDASPQNPPDGNESELITTVKISFVDSAGIEPIKQFVFSDLDGDGGNPPSVFDTIRISSQRTYNVSILLLDESKSPADTISNEVLAEGDDHMFFFFHAGANIASSYEDLDVNGIGIGLQSKWVTGSLSSGTSRIVLKHQPGIKDGTFAPGETDVDIQFQSRVE
ncbi:MAG: hypothetical protein ACKO0X_01400 [Bacteroidota bacterium]